MARILGLILAVSTAGANPKVDKIFERFDKPSSPGCSLAVMRDGQIVYKRAYGMANLDHDVVLKTSSVFHVASVSKQFTAASIVLLAQEGRLSLDDPVRKHIPELADFGAPLSIRHLVHHTSGLRDQWALLGLAGWRYSLDLITDDDVLEMISRQKALNFKPGDKHLYSNTGYTLMAIIVKRVSGQSLREFTKARFFDPLGMRDTHFRDDHAEIVKGMAYGYVPAKDAFRLSNTQFDTAGATSLLTTAEDMALWDKNFYDAKAGGAALIAQMTERGRLNDGETLSYAFGLSHAKHKGLTVVEHGGSDAGYRAHFMRFPEQRFSVACLCNVANANPSRLAREVADVYLPTEPAAPAQEQPTVSVSEEELKRYAGLYWNREDDQIRRFDFKDGKLRLLLPGNSIPLEAIAQDRFRSDNFPFEFRFEPSRVVEEAGSAKPTDYERAVEFVPSLRDYAGVYYSDEVDLPFHLVIQKEALVLKRLKSRPATLEPTVKDAFAGGPGNFRFLRDPRGRVSGFIYSSGRIRNMKFTRRLSTHVGLPIISQGIFEEGYPPVGSGLGAGWGRSRNHS